MTDQNLSYRVVCFGEVLWDCLPGGRVPGGAPLNVAYHLCKAGCDATVVSAVGDDELGRELLAIMNQWELETSRINIHDHLPTGTVEVALEDGIPSYSIRNGVAWDEISWDANASVMSEAEPSAIVFGSLAQRTHFNRESLEALLSQYPRAMRVFDVNLRPPDIDLPRIDELLGCADLVKLNIEEFEFLTQGQTSKNSLESRAREFADRYDCKKVCITRGKDGAAFLENDIWTEVQATPVNAVETVGAGDAFLASLLASIGRDNLDRVEALNRSTKLAGYVATQPGATPDY